VAPSDNTLISDDGAVRTILSSLQAHTAWMNNVQQNVNQIHDDVRAHYVADSSTIFQGKIQEWISAYQGVQKACNDLHDALTQATGQIHKGVSDAVHVGSGWSPSSSYYDTLTPHS
jgi:flagellar hook-associated protein FlgK